MSDIMSALIGAGSGLLGNLFNMNKQEDFNAQQMALAQQNMAQQKEFAQHGISWKVADAVSAGLHPLAALGANTTSFSPVSAGGSAATGDWSSMGQDLSRAAKAMATSQDRAAVDEEHGRRLALEKAGLENDILRADLASKVNRTSRASGQIGPPLPVSVAPVPLPRSGPNRTVSGLAVQDDDVKQKQGDIPSQSYSRPFGYRLDHNPYFSDGQVAEDRYGDSEILSTAKAAANLLADHVYTGYKIFPTEGWGIRGGGDRRRYRSRAREF